MHSYQPRWPEDRTDWEPPSPANFTYRDARDVAEFASIEPLTTWRTWPEVWHLDHTGRWCCCSKGSSLDSVRRFAETPERMLECRLESTGEPCPDYWVVLEPRRKWHPDRHEVTEEDAHSFSVLRRSLALFGITLLDVVIFHEDFRWWSLHELTFGSTAWTFEPLRRAERRQH